MYAIRSYYASRLEKGLDGITVGIPKEYHEREGMDPQVAKAVADSAAPTFPRDVRTTTIETDSRHDSSRREGTS